MYKRQKPAIFLTLVSKGRFLVFINKLFFVEKLN